MASSQLPVVVAVVVVVVLVSTTAVSGDAVTDEQGCRTELASLSPCLSYLTGKISTPSPTCCFQLKAIVETEPWCLCYGIIGQDNAIFGLPPNTPVNQTRALTLSNVCDIQGIPPIAGCKEVLPPGTTIPQLPAGAGQAGSSADGVASDDYGGPKSSSTTKSSYDNGNIKIPILMTLFLLFTTSSVYAIIML